MKDAIKALRAERKRLMAQVKQVDRTLKAAGAPEGGRKAKRRRRATNAPAEAPEPTAKTVRAKAAPQRKAAAAPKAATPAKAATSAKPPVSTPVQPAASKVGARRPGNETGARPTRNVDDLLSD